MELRAVIAGIFFGLWPLFMNKSGLNGNVSSIVFAGLAFIFIFPFAFKNWDWGAMINIKWSMAIAAGAFAAAGLLVFNGLLAKATPKEVGMLFVLMIIVQTVIPSVYYVILNGFSGTKIAGFVLAAIAAALLFI